MVSQLAGTAEDPGTVMSRIQHGSRTDSVKEILNLCPDVYASLVPYLKISRIEYEKDDPSKIKANSEKEIKIPNFLSNQDVLDITSGRIGRAPGSGIKSFSWELAGVQPAEVDNNITATMVVYFQSLNDFFANAASGSAYQAGKENEATFLDLIINSPGKPQTSSPSDETPKNTCPPDKKIREYDGVNFRIKATAGWAAPDNLGQMYGLDDTKARNLKQAIEDTRVTLFLQQVRHDIAMNDNGSVTLTITYQAALSGIGTSENYNILKPTSATLSKEEFSNLKALREQLKQEKAKETPDDDEIEELLEKINIIEQADRKAKYDSVLAGLFDDGRIYQIEVRYEDLLIKDLSVLNEQERREYFASRSGTDEATLTAEANVVNALNSAEGENGEELAEDAENSLAKSYQKFTKKAKKDKTARISFMYLGDIINNILQQIAKNNASPNGILNMNVFLGNIEFLNILKAFSLSDEQLKSVTSCRNQASFDALQQNEATQIYENINLSEIPISLDLFQSWFIKNVVKKDRTKYYFTQFMKDVVSQLVSNSLSGKCYGINNKFKFYQRFDVQPITYYKEGQVSPGNVVSLGKAVAAANKPISKNENIKNGLVMISTDNKPKNLLGSKSYDKDMEKGIYHQYMGAACGLLKTLNFQREDQPYLRESKIQKNGALGAEQLRELFSVDMNLIGNNLFKNGQYTYVSPVLINTNEQQLRLLGLHGYYMITSVKSTITENSFETTIRALQEGIEFPEQSSLGDTTEDQAEPTNSDNPSDSGFGSQVAGPL